MKNFLEFNSLVLAIFGVSIFGLLAKSLNILIKKSNERKELNKKEAEYLLKKEVETDKRFTQLEEGMIAILHDKIYNYCTDFIYKEYVEVSELDNLEYLFSSYKVLGGNGTGETLYKKVKEFPVKKGE